MSSGHVATFAPGSDAKSHSRSQRRGGILPMDHNERTHDRHDPEVSPGSLPEDLGGRQTGTVSLW